MNPTDAPSAKTHHLSATVHQIRKASLTDDFSGKLNFALNKRLRESGNSEFSPGPTVFRSGGKSGNKRGKRRLGPWVIIGRFAGKLALVHFLR